MSKNIENKVADNQLGFNGRGKLSLFTFYLSGYNY